jgi:hypothetical protein
MSSEAERFALNDQLVESVAAKTLSVQIADNAYTGTANAPVSHRHLPVIDRGNSCTALMRIVQMH